jgi:hypothetical protein
MRLPAIDFRRIRGYGSLGSQADGFEELASLLLVDGIVAWPEETRFERFGNPDGGREGRGVLADGTVWAWQAKYLFAFDSDELGQVSKSVERALSQEPSLARYFVVLPYDLPAGDTAKTKSAATKWREAAEKWRGLAVAQGMDVEFVYVGAHELVTALTRPGQAGRLRYWFDAGTFTPQSLAAVNARAIADAGPRYDTRAHVDLPIAGVLDAAGHTGAYETSLRRALGRLRASRRYAWRAPAEHADAFAGPLAAAGDALSTLDAALAGVAAAVADGCRRPNGVADELSAADDAVGSVRDVLHDRCLQKGGYFSGDAAGLYARTRDAEQALAELWSLTSGPRWTASQERLVVITGDGGSGKTHLLCDAAAARAAQGLPTLLLLGQHFDGRAPLAQIAELVQWDGPAAELLPTLAAAAQASGRRGLVMIDALNESQDSGMWRARLPGLVEQVLAEPWLALVVSCRTPYVPVVVPEAVLGRAAVAEHTGFRGATPEAVGRYLDAHGLEAPSFPLLEAELANPLFLRLICSGLVAQGRTAFPREGIALQGVYDAYLDAVDHRLADPSRCDYDPARRLAREAARLIASAAGERRTLPRADARQIADGLHPTGSWSRSLLKGLLDEQVLTATPVGGEEHVHFSFERLGDLTVASELCALPVDEAASELGRLAQAWGAHAGTLEAAAVLLPETHRVELVDAIGAAAQGGYARQRAVETLLDGLSFRSTASVTARTAELVGAVADGGGRAMRAAYDAVLGVSTVPGHPLNADWLHARLLGQAMPDRDLAWTEYCNAEHGDPRALTVLVDWAWSDASDRADDEVARLASVALGWCLTASHRPLRDRATKALVRLLENRPAVLAELLGAFGGVDDPYVVERLLAVAAGVSARREDAEARVAAGRAAAGLVAPPGRWPAGLLARDYARRAIEGAIGAGWQAPAGLAAAVIPPYGSAWPPATRSDAEIEALDGPPDYPYGSVTRSVIGQLGDFNKYVIGRHLRHVQPATGPGCTAAVAARRVFDRVLELGWTPERHGLADRRRRWEPARGELTERLGKKYQWIALHEVLGALFDNAPVGGQYDEPQRPYDDPSDLGARDIDPTLLLRGTGHAGFDEPPATWYSPEPAEVFADPNPGAWLVSQDGLPDPAALLTVHDGAGAAWTPLEGHYQWTERRAPEDEHALPYRRVWYQARAYLFDAGRTAEVEEWARAQDFSGRWMPESAENDGVLLADHPRHRSWRFNRSEDGNWHGRQPAPAELTPAAAWYGGASSYDQSSDAVMRGLVPSLAAHDLLGVRGGGDFRWHDDDGPVAADFAAIATGPASVHVRLDRLAASCVRQGVGVLWTVTGEKQLIDPESRYDFDDGIPVLLAVQEAYLLDGGAQRRVASETAPHLAAQGRAVGSPWQMTS